MITFFVRRSPSGHPFLTTALILLCLFPVTLYGANPALDDADMPRALVARPTGSPDNLWVSAQAILAPDGTVDPQVVPETSRRRIGALISAKPENGCIRMGPVFISYLNPPERSSIAEAVNSADIVLLGTVTGKAFGFFGGIPGQLLRITSEEAVKGDVTAQHHYVFIPIGDFWVGSAHICKTDPRYVSPPVTGDSLLAFSGPLLGGQGELLNTKDDAGIVVIGGTDGVVHLPRRLSSESERVQSANALKSFVRETAARARSGERQ